MRKDWPVNTQAYRKDTVHYLCGLEPATAVAEYTNATHTQLVHAGTHDWCDEIFKKVGLYPSAAPRLVPPGTQVGAQDRDVFGTVTAMIPRRCLARR